MRLTGLIRTVFLVTLLATAAAGCGAATTGAKPTVRIVSPVNGAKLSSGRVTVHVALSNFVLVPGGSGQKAGTGQVWFYVNGQLKVGGPSATATLVLGPDTYAPNTYAPDTYSLKAVLVTNGKPVASSAPVVVSTSSSNPVSCAHTPQPSTGLKAGTISLFCKGLPDGGAALGLLAGPGGDLWFPMGSTDANGTGGVGRITPSGVITVFSQGLPAGSGVGTLVTGPDGNVWFPVFPGTSNGTSAGIGRITPSGAITVFSRGLPAGSGVGNLVKGPDGNLWFSDGGGIGRITPSGVITVFSHGLPAGSTLGGFTTRPSGNLWFVVNGESTLAPHAGPPSLGPGLGIGRITPSGTITIFSHGLPAGSLAGGGLTGRNQQPGPLLVGPDGNLWFIVTPTPTSLEGASQGTPRIGRITPSGAITVFSHGLSPGSGIGNLVKGPDGNLWFSGGGGIGRITPSGVITVFSHGLPADEGIGRLTVGPDGSLWFTLTSSGAIAAGIGRITPAGAIAVFSQGPFAGYFRGSLIAGPDGNLWFSDGGEIGRITPTGTITVFNSQALTAGGGAGRLVTGSDGSLWFLVPHRSGCGLATTNAIGRIIP